MTKNNPPILLNEAFPDWFDGKGIFSEMEDMPWSEDVDAELLDLDYFGNHAGEKKCSPLVYKMLTDGVLSDSAREKLAALVVAKFLPNWEALWVTYHSDYDPLQDYSITETGSSEGQVAKTKSLTHNGSENINDSGSVTYGKSVATSETRAQDDDVTTTYGKTVTTSETRAQDDDVTTTYGKSVATSETRAEDDDVTTTFGATVSVMGTKESTGTQSKWGFNSADDVPTDKVVNEDSTGENTLHGGSDSSQRDISEIKSGNETLSGSDSTSRDISEITNGSEINAGSDSSQRDISELKSGTETESGTDTNMNARTTQSTFSDSGTENSSDADSYEKHFSGLNGNFTRQQLIQQERELWIEDYFTRVYIDIDTVLASLIYNREHKINPYYLYGFGYYSI